MTGSSLATLIVFLPLSFLSGVTGAFSQALSITMAAALVISYLMTAFVVPVLARHLVDFDRWRDPGAAGNSWFARGHGRLLDSLFARPWLFGVALVPLLAVGWFAYNAVPTGFMPAVDEGGFILDYYTPPGTSLTETSREVGQIDAMLSAIPEVATFSRRLGTGLGADLGESYHGDYFVRLKPNHHRLHARSDGSRIGGCAGESARRAGRTGTIDGRSYWRSYGRSPTNRDQALCVQHHRADPTSRKKLPPPSPRYIASTAICTPAGE